MGLRGGKHALLPGVNTDQHVCSRPDGFLLSLFGSCYIKHVWGFFQRQPLGRERRRARVPWTGSTALSRPAHCDGREQPCSAGKCEDWPQRQKGLCWHHVLVEIQASEAQGFCPWRLWSWRRNLFIYRENARQLPRAAHAPGVTVQIRSRRSTWAQNLNVPSARCLVTFRSVFRTLQ